MIDRHIDGWIDRYKKLLNKDICIGKYIYTYMQSRLIHDKGIDQLIEVRGKD